MPCVGSAAHKRSLLSQTLVSVQGLMRSFQLHGQKVEVLRGVDLTIQEGTSVGISGPSGCGKSTLLAILGLIDAEYEGQFRLFGRDVASSPEAARNEWRLRGMGVAFQDLWLVGSLTAEENVMLPAVARGEGTEAGMARARDLLTAAGLSHAFLHRPSELSGGERRRVALVRAMVNRPKLLLVDEPTAELDATSRAAVLRLVAQAQGEGSTLVAVSHDPELLASCRQRFQIRQGRLVPAA